MSNIKIYHTRILGTHRYEVPEEIGVYVITHTSNNLCAEKYVGSSVNLYKRIVQHNDKNIIYTDIYVVESESTARSLERILIKLIKPATNRIIQPLSDSDKELMDDLLKNTDILKEHESNCVKIGYRYLKYIDYEKVMELKNNEKQLKKVELELRLSKIKEKEKMNPPKIRIGKRKLTDTQSSRMMTFDKEYLDKIGFTAGTYTVIYETNKVSIVKDINNVIIINESDNKSDVNIINNLENVI